MSQMTKVLVITNKDDLTTDFVVNSLKKKQVPFYRLNTEELFDTAQLTINPQLGICKVYDGILNRIIDLTEYDSVYYRRPKIKDYKEDILSQGERIFLSNEVYYTLEGVYKILKDKFWVSPLLSIREAENKIYQLSIANKIGFKTPKSIITSNPLLYKEFVRSTCDDCIIKPVHNGRIMDVKMPQVVYTSELRGEYSDEIIESSPNFVQQRIKKQYDVRVTMVGNRAFSVRIHSQGNEITQTDWRKGQQIIKHEPITLPVDIENNCIRLMSILNLKYSAIDFAIDEQGYYVFFEINPNGQWAWIEHLTGMPISESIVNLLIKQNA